MGIGFVLLFWLIVFFVLSAVFALVSVLITLLFTNKENRQQKIIFAITAPFLGLISFFFLALIGSILVSEIKNVDMGIGDHWYVPIEDNCKLSFIDLPEQSYLDDDDKTVISGIQLIEYKNHKVYGITYDGDYFLYDLKLKKLKKFDNENQLISFNNNKNINFKTTNEFYTIRRNEVAGIWFIFVFILSGFLCIFILRKVYVKLVLT